MALLDRVRRIGRPLPADGLHGAGTPRLDPEVLFDEELLSRLRRLMLLSRQSLADGLAGEHRSRRRGSSPEFADFKSYSQGDDFRRIDWNIYSRLDEVFVRLSEVTTELSVHLMLDTSNSMAYRSHTELPTKFTYGRRVAGSLGYVALWHQDRLTCVPFGERLGAPFGPVQGRSQIMPMLAYLNGLTAGGQTNLPDAVERYAHGRRRPGILILVSDLLSSDADDLQQALRTLRTRGWQTTVVHILDQDELDPQLSFGQKPATIELIDLELGDRLRLTPSGDVLERYRAEVSRWQDDLEASCGSEQADYVRLQTDWPFETLVLAQLYRRGVVA